MTENATPPANRLQHESSLYLRQHAHNPVDWYAWGEEALARARRENKPILLSIGYSACHWCHVMAHESFENAATATVMNEHYVCIKVDREERPDLDKIYQTAHHVLTGRGGGWPLTMFLMPGDHTPFFAGTYFPDAPRYNMPSFVDVLLGVAEFFRDRRSELDQQNARLRAALQHSEASHAAVLTSTPLKRARELLSDSYDARHGGFGRAPKFPHPTNIERLLRHWAASRGASDADDAARDMALHTLRAMAEGGLYDQLGGGFFRYSTDERWAIPHFEKMLYDNGPLLCLYAQAWQITRDPLFERVVLETAQWTIREMQARDGGFYATLDADSEGEEGKFYVWAREAVDVVLVDEAMREVFVRHFGFTQPANFEGRWNLCVTESLADIARARHITEEQAQDLLNHARAKMLATRERRIRPGCDEKILTSWNGLMIKGMAAAGRTLKVPVLVACAQRALRFVRRELWRDGRLHATYQDGRARVMAYLDDHAFLIDAVLELLQARWDDDDFQFAIDLAEVMLRHFEDAENGGFFFTAHDHEALIQRPKPYADDALPSGNGIAAHALLRLGHLLGEPRYIRAAERTLRAAWEDISQFPHGCNALLLALEEMLSPGQTVIVRGARAALRPWIERCSADYAPTRLVLGIPSDARALRGALAAYHAEPERVVAYVCSGTQCSAPVESIAELDQLLR